MELDELRSHIQIFEKNLKQKEGGTISRKVLMSDINTIDVLVDAPNWDNKVKKYRMQGEYGPKKFIKP